MPIQKINKTELIVKSIEVFNKMGYTHTSMTDLAKSVGLQKGSIYHYFESKEQLLRHCIYFSKEFLSDQVFHIAYQDDLSPEVRMELIFNKLSGVFLWQSLFGNFKYGTRRQYATPRFF